jgi:hypothetical protein
MSYLSICSPNLVGIYRFYSPYEHAVFGLVWFDLASYQAKIKVEARVQEGGNGLVLTNI